MGMHDVKSTKTINKNKKEKRCVHILNKKSFLVLIDKFYHKYHHPAACGWCIYLQCFGTFYARSTYRKSPSRCGAVQWQGFLEALKKKNRDPILNGRTFKHLD